jgi:hypothetical protein
LQMIEIDKERQRSTPFLRFCHWMAPSLKDPARFPDYLVAVCTLGLAIFAFLAWIEATHGTKALQDQLTVLRAEQRAWLAPGGLTPSPDFKMHADPPYEPAVIALSVTNTGKEPAQYINQSVDVRLIDNAWDVPKITSVISGILNGKTCKETRIDKNGSALFPNGTRRILFRLGEEQSRTALSGGHYVMVAGCLNYQTLGESRWSEVCEFLDPIAPPEAPGFRSAFCPVHNQAY